MKIEKLTEQYFKETFELINSNFERKIGVTYLKDSMINPASATYILLSDDNELIATAGIRDLSRICWLASKYKKRGYARKLMNFIMDNHKDLYLFVKQNNIPAIQLYKSLGFYVSGTHENSFRMEL